MSNLIERFNVLHDKMIQARIAADKVRAQVPKLTVDLAGVSERKSAHVLTEARKLERELMDNSEQLEALEEIEAEASKAFRAYLAENKLGIANDYRDELSRVGDNLQFDLDGMVDSLREMVEAAEGIYSFQRMRRHHAGDSGRVFPRTPWGDVIRGGGQFNKATRDEMLRGLVEAFIEGRL